ncbi:MAG: translation initiation factor IF-1 [Candidatus Absconditabacteria bacterium]
MVNESTIEVEGQIVKVIGHGSYQVAIDEIDLVVIAKVSGKMKKFNIKIIEGDRVKVELNEYDPTKGRIIYRFK